MKHRFLYLCIFASLIVLIGVLGFYFNRYLRERQKKEFYTNLTTLAQLKIQTVINWRDERKSEAEFLSSNDYLRDLVSGYIRNPKEKNLHILREILKPFILKPDYADAVLISGSKLISLSGESFEATEKELSNAALAKKLNKVILSGFHHDSENKVCMDTFIPLTDRGKDSVSGILLLKIDPSMELFPLISAKPPLRKTFEAYVVGKEGDSVVYYNKLRYIRNSAAFFRLPLSTPALASAMAIRGYSGIYEGKDYAGNGVLADLHKISDSEWYMVSKIHFEEVYASLEEQMKYVFAGALLLMVISGLLVYTLSKEQRIFYLNRELEFEKNTAAIIKKAEEALLESESKLLEAQSLAHLGSWEYDLEKNVLTWTNEVYRIFGLDPERYKPTYDSFLKFIHPEDLHPVNDAYTNSLKERRNTYEIEHRILKQDTGEIRYVHEKCRNEYDNNGKVMRSVGMVQDITDQVKSNEALLSSEEKFAKAFSANPNALVISYVDSGKIIEVNDTFLRIYGYSREEVIGRTSLEIHMYVDPEDRKRAKDQLITDGYLRNFEVRHRLKTGEVIIVLLSIELLQMNMGKTMLTIIQDITERKQNEIALRQSEAKLIEAQRLASLGSYTIHLNSETAELSEETCRIFGIEKSGNIHSLDEVFRYIHPDDLSRIKVLYGDINNNPETKEYEFRIITAEGLKYIYAFGKPLIDSTGNVEGIFGTLMDITQRKNAQMKLEGILRELMRSNKDLEEFAYTASHDLQEPIRMIKSYTQLLEMKNKEQLDESSNQYLSFISDGATRMQQLVDDLLKYSRVSTTKRQFEIVDCNQVVNNVLKDLKFRIEDEKADVKVDELPTIRGDETQLRQLFQNFLHNALKFRSEKLPEINICCVRKNNQWLFSISDNGIGIEPMFYERIFVIFQRLHERDKYPGTGIGLALCKKIVERHGGQVCVDSEIGKGTTFYFTMPAEGE